MQFLCPNCNVISDIFGIKIDEQKRDKANDVQKEIDELELQIENEENKRLKKLAYIAMLEGDILAKTILKRMYETEYSYIDCSVCQHRHYIKETEKRKSD